MKTHQSRNPEHGFSLIEMMVGVVIGLIAILVVYQVFAAAEGIKRNTTSVGDAQQNGLLSSFMLGIELANAGNGIASAARDLGACPGGITFASTWRPIPVMIVAGAGASDPDSFLVGYSVSNAVIAPAPFTATAAANAAYTVQSPTGFQANDLIVAVGGTPSAAGCAASVVTAVSAADINGVVTITHTNPGVAATFGSGAALFNMGPVGTAQKVQYDVTAAGILRSTTLFHADGTPNDDLSTPPNPLASNVVNMKLQYGLDTNADGVLEWVDAHTSPWKPEDLMANTPANNLIAQLKTLKAVRIGIVVRGEQWDKNLLTPVPWSLFGGVYSGTFLPAGGNYRYRTYETVIPIRNELWNTL